MTTATFMIAAALSVAPPPEGEVFDFAAVRDRVRAIRGTLPAGETVEVVFSPGVYRIADTLALYKADGHAVYRASEKGRVRFTGGVAVPQGAFRDARVNGVRARVADVAPLLPAELPPWPKEFRAPPAPWLYRNGRPLEIARWPNGEEWMVSSNAVVSALDAAAAKGAKSDDSIGCADPRAKTWDFSRGVWFYGYWCHDWAESYVQGAGYDDATKTLKFIGRHQYGFGGKTWGISGRRFFALNALSEIRWPRSIRPGSGISTGRGNGCTSSRRRTRRMPAMRSRRSKSRSSGPTDSSTACSAASSSNAHMLRLRSFSTTRREFGSRTAPLSISAVPRSS